MGRVCDIDISRRTRSEERSDAVRIVSDERRRAGGKYRCPYRLREATQTHPISQTGS